MKKIIILSIGILLYTVCFSQSCLPEGIIFTTQSQIDSFHINYPNCTQIEGDVLILSGYGINNLLGLIQILNIEGNLEINTNLNLSSLSGFDNLQQIGGTLDINYNNVIHNLSGLENLTSVGGNLKIEYNWELNSLSGLEALTSIGGGIWITNNFYLTSITGISNINPSTITDLHIFRNLDLTNCEAQSICDYLVAPCGVVDIYMNSSGCMDHSEMMATCGNSPSCLPYGNYYFLNQIDIDSFQVNYPNCTDLWGDVIINDNIYNLNGLYTIDSIGGELRIGAIPLGSLYLENLFGLEGLSGVGGNLSIYCNSSLTSLMGLENVQSIGENLYIVHNDVLNNLTGLEGLNYLNGMLYIDGNLSLTSLTGIDNIDANSISDLTFSSNISLFDCDVRSVCDYLANPNGIIEIHDNATGCNSQQEVEDACFTNISDITHAGNYISVFPNPFSSQLTIKLPYNPSGNKTTLIILNSCEQQIIAHQILDPQTILDLSGLSNGIYVVKIIGQDNVLVKKIVKN